MRARARSRVLPREWAQTNASHVQTVRVEQRRALGSRRSRDDALEHTSDGIRTARAREARRGARAARRIEWRSALNAAAAAAAAAAAVVVVARALRG